MLKTSVKTVLLFGSFDGIHPGHEYLINEAKKYGSKIIIVVAQDTIIKLIKQRPPIYPLRIRIEHLHKQFINIIPIAGDVRQETWSAIDKYRPETILVGYDQDKLYEALLGIQSTYHFQLVQVPPFHPEQYKSSLLRKK